MTAAEKTEARANAAADCLYEAARVLHHASAAKKAAKAGQVLAAEAAAESARIAAICALDAHSALLAAAQENMTAHEKRALDASELAQDAASKAERIACLCAKRAAEAGASITPCPDGKHEWECESSISPDSGMEYFTCTKCGAVEKIIYY